MSHEVDAHGTTGTRPRRARVAAVGAILAIIAGGVWLTSRSGSGGDEADRIAALIASGRVDEAARSASAWLDRRPGNPEALAWSARAALAADRPAEAADFARRAQQAGLDRAALRDVEGVIVARSGRPAEAEPMLRAHLAESTRPEPTAARALAEAGLATFRFDIAREALARWRRDAPRDVRPWLIEAEVADRVGDPPEKVIEPLRKALLLDPDHAEARTRLADALRRAGRLDEAAEQFDRVLARSPEDATALASAGLNALDRGRLDEAERLLTRALDRDPDHVEALKGLAHVLQRTGRDEEALARFEHAAEVEPEDAEIAYQRFLLLSRLGRREEAERMRVRSEQLHAQSDEIERLRNALVRAPNNVNLQFETARWLIEHGHPEEGLRWAEKVLDARPGHRPTCLLLADHYEAAGQPDLASYYRFQAEAPGNDPDAAPR